MTEKNESPESSVSQRQADSPTGTGDLGSPTGNDPSGAKPRTDLLDYLQANPNFQGIEIKGKFFPNPNYKPKKDVSLLEAIAPDVKQTKETTKGNPHQTSEGDQNMEPTQSSKSLKLLRWIVFFPLAALAAWLAWIIINILGRFSLGLSGVGPDDYIGKFYSVTAGHAAMGAAFVYFGTKIVPSHRVVVAYVLAGIGILVAGFLLFPAVMARDWWAVWAGIMVAVGAGAVVFSLGTGETVIE